ncbi:MAG: hypothetical protein GXP38_05495, partial [Chloroflexi bacterium]|nr:hypothetical protein [Chloroflexota bacterium]
MNPAIPLLPPHHPFPTSSNVMSNDSALQLPQVAHLRQILDENERTKTFIFSVSWEAEPGQFLMAWLPRFDEKPFSLVDDHPLTITVARVGPFSEYLHHMQIGECVWLRGPFGHGFEIRGEHLLVVGGGYGIAPLSFLTQRARQAGKEVSAIVGARSEKELFFLNRLRREGARVMVATEDGSASEKGLVTDLMAPFLQQSKVDGVFACGPGAMLEAVAALAQK